MEKSLVFIKAGIVFPDDAYLVFFIRNNSGSEIIKVTESSKINYLCDNGSQFVIAQETPADSWSINGFLELQISGAQANNVRWFDVEEDINGNWIVRPKGYKPKDLGFRFIVTSLFTLGIYGYCCLKRENRQLNKISVNLDKICKDLHMFQNDHLSKIAGENDSRLHELIAENTRLSEELNGLGSEEDRTIIKKIGLREGDWKRVNEDINFSRDVSNLFSSNDFFRIKNERDEYISNQAKLTLQSDRITELTEREKEWQRLANGNTLERLIELKNENENLNMTKQGLAFEEEVERMLRNFESPLGFNVNKQVQKKGGRKRIDLVINIQKDGQTYTVVVECKWHHEYQQEMCSGLLSYDKKINGNFKKNINVGLEQLCEYYKAKNAHIGLLVTNIGDKTIKVIEDDEIPNGYVGVNLLWVHVSCLETLIKIIKLVVDIQVPTIDPKIERESLQLMFRSPVLNQFIRDISGEIQGFEKLIKEMVTQINKCEENIKKTISKIEPVQREFRIICDLIRGLSNKRDQYSDSSSVPLLEHTNEDLVSEEGDISLDYTSEEE